MAICPKGPDVSTFCVDVCRERCPATKESCPGKNIEACIGACPSDLKLFEICVDVCKWRCPFESEDAIDDFIVEEIYDEYDPDQYDQDDYDLEDNEYDFDQNYDENQYDEEYNENKKEEEKKVEIIVAENYDDDYEDKTENYDDYEEKSENYDNYDEKSEENYDDYEEIGENGSFEARGMILIVFDFVFYNINISSNPIFFIFILIQLF